MTTSSAMFPPSFFGVQGNEVINKLSRGVLTLIPVNVEPMSEALLDLIDDKLCEVLTLKHNGGDHCVNV